jgi:hypothetical protein
MSASPTLPPYECAQIVYRAIIKEDWIRPGGRKVRKQAFYRFNIDTDGLSVNPTPKDAFNYFTREQVFGFVSLHVGRLRDHGLDVIPNRADHANIVEIPTRDQNRDEAMRLAELLADELGRVVPDDELVRLLA